LFLRIFLRFFGLFQRAGLVNATVFDGDFADSGQGIHEPNCLRSRATKSPGKAFNIIGGGLASRRGEGNQGDENAALFQRQALRA
jgi:hypothetical protein